MNKKISTILITVGVIWIFAMVGYATMWSFYMVKEQPSFPKQRNAMEQRIPDKSFTLKNDKLYTQVDIVEIDGVEYLIASTAKGVSICKK